MEAGLSDLKQDQGCLLIVLDNGIGLDQKRMNSLLSDGASEKSYDLSGSYGVGHIVPMALSNIRYMMYGGVTKDGQRIACGRTILASHPGKKELLSAEGYLIREFKPGLDGNLYEFLNVNSHPKLISRSIDEIESEWGHGCSVLIPSFNNFGGEDKDLHLWTIVSKVASYNFSGSHPERQTRR